MPTVSNSTIDFVATASPKSPLVRRRFWIYLALLLVAGALAFAGRQRTTPAAPVSVKAGTAASVTPASTQDDDRPAILPDR